MEWSTSVANGSYFDPADTKNKNLKKAILEQKYIGWDQIMHRRISSEFEFYQDSHLDQTSQQGTETLNGRKWCIQVVITFWKYFHDVWESRNHALHGLNAYSNAAHKTLLSKVRYVFDLKPWFPAEHRHVLENAPYEIIETKSNPWIETWLALAKSYIQQAEQNKNPAQQEHSIFTQPRYRQTLPLNQTRSQPQRTNRPSSPNTHQNLTPKPSSGAATLNYYFPSGL